eukprot:gb/GEZJ01006739.1/.p1 GENE.gb/GEZJ01006739.1/~~gb/GEZJ01006739.1/.p1  ORF type:complete len:135 (-),score=21.10 gb/GEZJ01006739.1/:500-904(-)
MKSGKNGPQPSPVVAYDHQSRTVTVPDANNKTILAAIEDVRPAVGNDALAAVLHDVIDDLDHSVFLSMTEFHSDDSGKRSTEPHFHEFAEFCSDSSMDEANGLFVEVQKEHASVLSEVGDIIKVYWPIDDQYYR